MVRYMNFNQLPNLLYIMLIGILIFGIISFIVRRLFKLFIILLLIGLVIIVIFM